MRISLLEKREDFYKILVNTLKNTDYSLVTRHDKSVFYINKYLNFVASSSLSVDVFKILVNEYSSSLQWYKQIIQSTYVKLAVSRLFRTLLSQKKIFLSSSFANKLILGGNHRLRLFSKELDSSIVILKVGERVSYINRDTFVRSNYDICYAPKLLLVEDEWYKEEYFEGTPINRLQNINLISDIIASVINEHWNKLILESKYLVIREKYIDNIESEINCITQSKKITSIHEIISRIYNVKEMLFLKLSVDMIDVSWTHGDFQQANIIAKDGSYKVIDWETASRRFYLYDMFILLGEIRTGISLSKAIYNFKKKSTTYTFIRPINENDITLLLIEELRFSVNEEFSVNFYLSGKNTLKLCQEIEEYLA